MLILNGNFSAKDIQKNIQAESDGKPQRFTADELANNPDLANNQNIENICTIEKPEGNEAITYALQADKIYDIKFEMSDIKDVAQTDNGLSCTFIDGSKVFFETAENILHQDLPASDENHLNSVDVIQQLIAFMGASQGNIIGDIDSYQTATMTIDASYAQQMASIEPGENLQTAQLDESCTVANPDGATTIVTDSNNIPNLGPLADLLSDINPASGAGGSSGAHSGGFGFQSSAETISLKNLSAIGPIAPTALNYHAEFYNPQGIDTGGQRAALTSNNVIPPQIDLSVNNNVNSIIIKEDGQGVVPLTAHYSGGMGSEVMTLTITGVDPSWTVTAPGWAHNNDGTYSISLAAGQTDYTGNFTFKPPHNSDADMTGIHFQASVFNPVTGQNASDGHDFSVAVDAVVDAPALAVPTTIQQSWYYYHASYQTPLKISSHVTDMDGSETVDKIVIKLDNPFSQSHPPYNSLADMGITLNKGTETSHGVWEIQVHNGDATAALNGLALVVPNNMNYSIIHGPGHQTDITVISYVSEAHINGLENDLSDNQNSVTQNIHLTFQISPLVLDLDGNGIDLVNIEHGVMFDMNNDGIADHTSWVGGNDALLALDINHDGLVNNQSELFGDNDHARDGFANLAQYDINQDGKIDTADAIWKDLIVWQDTNQDGVSQASEKHILSDFNIVAINLNSTDSHYSIGDSTIIQESTFVYGDGHTGQIVDAAFSVDAGKAQDGHNLQMDGKPDDDTLRAGDGDVLTGTSGADKFILDAISKGVDVIKDFSRDEGDVLDFSSFFQHTDQVQQSINNFVFSREVDGGTIISVDVNGTGDAARAVDVVALQGMHDVSVPDLVQSGNLHVM